MSNAEQILAGLGGAANILELEPCITRLRLKVANPDVIEEKVLTAAGSRGLVISGRIVQVIIGPEAEELCVDLAKLLNDADSDVDVQLPS